jgi:Domain of unknown function (DUF1707)
MPDPGMMPHAFAGPPGMLAANADRERAIDVLKAGFAESRLTKAEYDDRTARVYAARTYGDLGALVADLPGLALGWAGIGLIAAIIAGLIVATSISGHSLHPVVSHPVPRAPGGGPLQGG